MVDGGTVVVIARETLAVAQVVDSVEHVGFPHAIVADKAIDLGRELQLRLDDVLIIHYGKLFKSHVSWVYTAKLVNSFRFSVIRSQFFWIIVLEKEEQRHTRNRDNGTEHAFGSDGLLKEPPCRQNDDDWGECHEGAGDARTGILHCQ